MGSRNRSFFRLSLLALMILLVAGAAYRAFASGKPSLGPPSAVTTSTPVTSAANTRIVQATASQPPAEQRTPGPITALQVTPQPSGCSFFPPDNIWNRKISDLPVDSRSDIYVASIGADTALHTGFTAGTWEGQTLGMPYTTVPGNQPRVPVTFEYEDQSDQGLYPIPTNAPIEQNASTDRHVMVLDRDNCVLYEIWHASPHSDGSWSGGAGAVFNLLSNKLRPDGWTSADAAGMPILPSLVRYDEVASGAINHALRFTAPAVNAAHVWPARHSDGTTTDPNVPPMGTRFRLKASVDISGYPAEARVILQALKDYGLFLADTGQAWNIDGVPDERWNNDALRSIWNLHGSDFEAVDESGLMADPNSGQVRQPRGAGTAPDRRGALEKPGQAP